MGWSVVPEPAVVEAVEPEAWDEVIFVHGLHRIEMLQDTAIFVMHRLERCPRTGEERRVVQSKRIEAPFGAIAPAARMMFNCLTQRWGRSAAGVLVPS